MSAGGAMGVLGPLHAPDGPRRPAESRPGSPGVRATRVRLSRRECSVGDHVAATMDRLRTVDAGLGAFVSIAGDEVWHDAEVADATIARLGDAAWLRQPLLGVTVAVKDLIQTGDLPTSRGSLLENRRAQVDAPAVARLRRAGAIVVGKTTTSEHGWSASTVSRVAGPTRNPWHPQRSAGGSSGGSAAAVAAGLCAAALGTDGAGSIRIPAAFCGVVGFKPSFGRVPYVPPCADRLSHLGPLANDVGDVIEIMAVLGGPDPGDPDSAIGWPVPVRRRSRLRVGWVEFPGTAPEVAGTTEAALAVLAGSGHCVERLAMPFPDPYPALVDTLAAAEAAGLASEDEERCDPGRVALARFGRTVTGTALVRAEEVRLALRARSAEVMDRYDLLAMATVPIPPFGVDAIAPAATTPGEIDWLAWSPATYPFNITGQPAVSLPVGLSHGLPVGLQLVGPVGGDALVLAAARALEAALEPLPELPAPADPVRRAGPASERIS